MSDAPKPKPRAPKPVKAWAVVTRRGAIMLASVRRVRQEARNAFDNRMSPKGRVGSRPIRVVITPEARDE